MPTRLTPFYRFRWKFTNPTFPSNLSMGNTKIPFHYIFSAFLFNIFHFAFLFFFGKNKDTSFYTIWRNLDDIWNGPSHVSINRTSCSFFRFRLPDSSNWSAYSSFFKRAGEANCWNSNVFLSVTFTASAFPIHAISASSRAIPLFVPTLMHLHGLPDVWINATLAYSERWFSE